jgi:hypothetical protein
MRLVLAIVFSIIGIAGVFLMTRYRPGGQVR